MASRQSDPSPSTPSARQRAVEAYDSTRERARETVGGSPLLALGGGLAIGAVVAALLPRTEMEDRLLGDAGERVTSGAKNAFSAATEAGREKLAELNITREAGKGAVQSLVDGLTEAARTSGQAAIEAARGKA